MTHWNAITIFFLQNKKGQETLGYTLHIVIIKRLGIRITLLYKSKAPRRRFKMSSIRFSWPFASQCLWPYRVGKLAFSHTCTVRAPQGVSMALDCACKVKRKFTQCVAHASVIVTLGINQPFLDSKGRWYKCHIFEICKLSNFCFWNMDMVPVQRKKTLICN